jgi:hypothetical protein
LEKSVTETILDFDVQMLDSEAVKNVLSLMYSCGMYNYSGQFAFKVTYCRTSANIKIEGSSWNYMSLLPTIFI